MIRIMLLLAFLGLFSIENEAQTFTLTGKVIDQDKKEIDAAIVS